MRRSYEAELPGYAITEAASSSDSDLGVRLADVQTGSDFARPHGHTGQPVASGAKSEIGSENGTVEGSLHFSDRVGLDQPDTYTCNAGEAAATVMTPDVQNKLEGMVARITAEQEVRFQRTLEEQARRFEAVLRQTRQ